MTEAEWLAFTDARHLVSEARHQRIVSERKATLFGCACVYRIWSLLDDHRSRLGVEMTEQFADGEVPLTLREAAANSALVARNEGVHTSQPFVHDAAFQLARGHITSAVQAAGWAVARLSGVKPGTETWQSAFSTENTAQLHLAHCIFGNPFRPVAADPSWRTSTVVALAEQMYESRDFAPMPVLADALQDAGCDNADVLDHCRGAGPHVRGCWVVDLLLGKK